MGKLNNRKGFSLIEIMLALGVLALGMLLAAGTFSAALQFSKVSTERTIGAVVADEAFAKIKLYATDCNNLIMFSNINQTGVNFEYLFDINKVPMATLLDIQKFTEFSYPSSNTEEYKQYYWSAVCRKVDTVNPDDRLVQVTVFVCRKTSANLKYYYVDSSNNYIPIDRPTALKVAITVTGNSQMTIKPPINFSNYINDGSTILIGWTGQLCRVRERSGNIIDLENVIQGDTTRIQTVWVVPPPAITVSSVPSAVTGSNPCIGVYQKMIRF